MGKKLIKTYKVDFSADNIQFGWYVVVTSFNWERKAAENIEKRFHSMGFGDKFGEIVVPIVEFEEINAKGKRVKKSRNLLESGYIFIKMVMTNDTWNVVRQTTGVAGWLNRDGRPARQFDEDVVKWKKMLGTETEEEKQLSKFAGKIGDTIQVINHTFAGIEAKVTGVSEDKETIKAVVELNGMKLELKADQVKIV